MRRREIKVASEQGMRSKRRGMKIVQLSKSNARS
jgi:hypothetical protein